MTPTFEQLRDRLRKLPGLGLRSAERLALHLLVEQPERLAPLIEALQRAGERLTRCATCGNLCERGEADPPQCDLCADSARDPAQLCIVESIPDLYALERAGAFRGRYHVLHGKLSPIHGVGPEQLNLGPLRERLEAGEVRQVTLALSNDIEGEATCHYLQEELLAGRGLQVARIGFGLPSGGGLALADDTTLRAAFEGRRELT